MIFTEDGVYLPRRTEKADCGCEALMLIAGGPGGPLGPGGPSGPEEKKQHRLYKRTFILKDHFAVIQNLDAFAATFLIKI